jgi:hypothetical protein
MAKRKGSTQHYERCFEQILRENGILYLAIDESKRPKYENKTIKNFDFIVSSFNGKYLVDIKGKSFPYREGGFWENWIKIDDVSGLKLWSSHFNAFCPLLVYPYHIKKKIYKDQFKDIFRYKGNTYGIVAIELSKYYINAKARSKGWGAIYISRNNFKELVKPISYFIPELRKKW